MRGVGLQRIGLQPIGDQMIDLRYHPALQGFEPPRAVELGAYRLTILAPDAVEEDYAAVIESAARLRGFMGGDWPDGLTLEDNWIDLAWHLREFDTKRSFAWIVRDQAKGYLGCAYVFPRFMEDAANVSVWMRSGAGPEAHEHAFSALLTDWLTGPDWPDLDYRLRTPSG